MKNKHQATVDLINQAAYETYLHRNPAMVGSIAQLLRMGETPERIQQAISAKIPGPPVAIEIIRMIAEHQNKLTKEN